MSPEMGKLVTDILSAVTTGVTTLIGAAVAYGVWKLREMQQDRRAAAVEKSNTRDHEFLNGLITSTVAYINQTIVPKRMPGGFDRETAAQLKMEASRHILKRVPGPVKERLESFYGSLAALNDYIAFKIESEVWMQKPEKRDACAPGG